MSDARFEDVVVAYYERVAREARVKAIEDVLGFTSDSHEMNAAMTGYRELILAGVEAANRTWRNEFVLILDLMDAMAQLLNTVLTDPESRVHDKHTPEIVAVIDRIRGKFV